MRSDWVPILLPLALALFALEAVRLVAKRREERHRWSLAGAVARRCGRPAWFVALVAVLEVVLPGRISEGARDGVGHALTIALITAVTWLGVQIVYAAVDVALSRLNRALGTRDNRRARRARTQLLVVRRVVAVVGVVIAAGAILLTFERVRTLGAGVLASAGIAGALAGVAARPTLGNLIGGMQIAFSDMLRIDDVVVVEGEWGRVDEITLTYVVVRTWDERRLILPTSYFVDNPFQNWTRHESRVIGTVTLTLDFAVPVDAIRQETKRIIENCPLWDGREWVVQVSDVATQGVQLRILMSASDAASSWDLQCEVRERLVEFIRTRYAEALPRVRVEAVPGSLEVPADWADSYPGDPTDARQPGKSAPRPNRS